MLKYICYILCAIMILFLALSNIMIRDYKCSLDKNLKFVVIGGKHYPCYNNIK